jgi:hypothetical protein
VRGGSGAGGAAVGAGAGAAVGLGAGAAVYGAGQREDGNGRGPYMHAPDASPWATRSDIALQNLDTPPAYSSQEPVKPREFA